MPSISMHMRSIYAGAAGAQVEELEIKTRVHRKSNAVRQKAKRREGDARKAKRKEKVQFRGKVRR